MGLTTHNHNLKGDTMKTETYQFTTARQLRDFLNQFKATDLDTVYLESCGGSGITVDYDEQPLTDGSIVISMEFK